MKIVTYERRAGSFGYVEEVGTDAYLNCGTRGTLGHIANVESDWKAVKAFAKDKFWAANYQAQYGYVPAAVNGGYGIFIDANGVGKFI